MRISVVTPRFGLGGVPFAQIRFARALAKRGHEVDLVVGYVQPEYKFPSTSGVNVHLWSQPKVRGMLFPLMRYLRSVKPDVVFSAEDHMNTITLLAAMFSGSKAKISGSSRVAPSDTYSDLPFPRRWMLKQLARAVMRRADALTCVSKDMVTQYRNVFKSPPHVCVYNIADDRHSRLRMQEPVEHEWLDQNSENKILLAVLSIKRLLHFEICVFGVIHTHIPVEYMTL